MGRAGTERYWTALVVLGLVSAAVLIWAFQPLSETMQVGTDFSTGSPTLYSVTFECNNAFSSTNRSTEVPVLPPQPEGEQPLAYPREPCEFVQSDARNALIIFALFVVVAAGALLWFGFVRDRRGAKDRSHEVSPEEFLVG